MCAGMGPELTRGVLSAALMLMLKERLYTMNRNLLLRQRVRGKEGREGWRAIPLGECC